MKHLLKGQIPREYQLDYKITFTEQSATVYEKLIPELKRLMAGHFNLLSHSYRIGFIVFISTEGIAFKNKTLEN